MSHPTWVRGLKLQYVNFINDKPMSHPTWVRGLKQTSRGALDWRSRSHPTWVRGLKLRTVPLNSAAYVVAPYMGAWIETWC